MRLPAAARSVVPLPVALRCWAHPAQGGALVGRTELSAEELRQHEVLKALKPPALGIESHDFH